MVNDGPFTPLLERKGPGAGRKPPSVPLKPLCREGQGLERTPMKQDHAPPEKGGWHWPHSAAWLAGGSD